LDAARWIRTPKLLILPGFAENVEMRGYLVERCPDCHQVGPFAIYEAKRKFTVWFVPLATIGSKDIMECRTCGARFGLPGDIKAELPARLLSQDQLSARIREARAGQRVAERQPRRAVTAYQVLQVDPSADQEVLDAAFKRLALKYHPDRSAEPNAADRMRELNEARALLSDPARRRSYDASLGIRRGNGARERMSYRAVAVRPDEV
jgi:DnaJ-domain-containing protein 1